MSDNERLSATVDYERRLVEIGRFLVEFESTYGEITEHDIRNAVRKARTEATVVRGAHFAG